MRGVLIIFFCYIVSLACASRISVEMQQDGLYYLASYYGEGVRVIDSLVVMDGISEYSCVSDLPQGIYFLSNAQGDRFDFLLGDDQEFDVRIDLLNLQNASILGAVESERFLKYQKAIPFVLDDAARCQLIDDCLLGIDVNSVLRLVLDAMRPVVYDGSTLIMQDRITAYDVKVAHYWDNYDLGDDRILRTPFLSKRLEGYCNQLLLPRHDKMMEGLLPLLQKAEANTEVLRFVASRVLTFAVANETMGVDALAYEIISRYYLSGRLGVLPKKQLAMLLDYARYTVDCRMGYRAKEMVLSSWYEHEEVSLFNTKAKYTLLLFWEPDCDYCKALIPVLRDQVLPRYASLGLAVFAVNTQRNELVWRDYIVEHHLEDWVHGIQTTGDSEFMVHYGVQGTPFIYILDQEKRIVAKNVKLDFIDSILSRLFATGNIY